MQPLVEAAGNPRVAIDKLNNLYFLILALQPGLGIVLPSGPLKEWPTQQNEGHREGLKRKRLTAPGNRQPVVGKVVAEIPHESGRRVITKVALDLRGVPTARPRNAGRRVPGGSTHRRSEARTPDLVRAQPGRCTAPRWPGTRSQYDGRTPSETGRGGRQKRSVRPARPGDGGARMHGRQCQGRR